MSLSYFFNYAINFQSNRRYFTALGIDAFEGHLEYSEAPSNPFVTDRRGWYTYIKDQVGTITKTYSHGNSQVVNTRAYDTFGNLISHTDTSKGNLGFQSKYLDPESGLYYFYHRYYSPSLGRFTTEDPIGIKGGLNMNAFVRHNPMNNTDYYGLVEGNDWQWMMPNGGGLDKINYHDFDVIWEHAGWFWEGVTSSSSKCCYINFFKCMGLPDFKDPITTSSSLVYYWQKTGWIYGPMNVPAFQYLGNTAVSFNWGWYKFTGNSAKFLSKASLWLTVASLYDCGFRLAKCMGGF